MAKTVSIHNRFQLLPQVLSIPQKNLLPFNIKGVSLREKSARYGCGPGNTLLYYAHGCDVTAFDLSELNIQKKKK